MSWIRESQGICNVVRENQCNDNIGLGENDCCLIAYFHRPEVFSHLTKHVFIKYLCSYYVVLTHFFPSFELLAKCLHHLKYPTFQNLSYILINYLSFGCFFLTHVSGIWPDIFTITRMKNVLYILWTFVCELFFLWLIAIFGFLFCAS